MPTFRMVEVFGFQITSTGHPSNTADGLRTVTAFACWQMSPMGIRRAAVEMTMLTALRTAADVGGWWPRLLAPKGAHCMAMIGKRAQSEFQTLAMKAIVGIDEVRCMTRQRTPPPNVRRTCKGGCFKVVPCDTAAGGHAGRGKSSTTCPPQINITHHPHDNMIGAGIHHQRHRAAIARQTGIGPLRFLHRAGILCVKYPEQDRYRRAEDSKQL